MNKLSIKFKIVLWYTIVMIVVAVGTLYVTSSISQDILIRDSYGRLIGSVNDMAKVMTMPRDNMKKMPGSHFFDKGIHTGVYDENHNLIGGYIPFDFVDEIALEDEKREEVKINGENYIYYIKKADSPSEPVWILGVISVANETRMFDSVFKTNMIIILVLILAASIGGYFILKKAFKPVDKISKTAKAISESSDLSRRIGLGNGNDEIYRLGETFDEMLDKIESTMEAEKQFTSDASHELRTPVAVINSECEYAMDCAKTVDEAKESIQAIKRQSDKMSKLISELLTISRMDRNTQQINLEQVDLSELLSMVCDEQKEIGREDIKLETDIPKDIFVNADRFMITRLFINLISNGYRYGKENGKVKVSLLEKENYIEVQVEDDGIGIKKEDLSKIWERFYQVDTARRNDDGSMGLGLSMVKWIAQCHGGKVEVSSELGKGSTFVFTMPKGL